MSATHDFSRSIGPSNIDRAFEERPVHEWFQQQVLRTPYATALVTINESLSYLELNDRSTKLAARLIAEGIGPDVLVALCMDHCVEMVVAILGVLKAGGAYVPIDVNNPDKRIQFILRDTSAAILLTVSELSHRLGGMGTDLICVDQVLQNNCYPMTEFTSHSRMDHLVYCIYTSGSTGQPKGALNEHRGLANLVKWYIVDAGMSAKDRVIVASSVGFDLTQKNILAPLCIGACVLLPACSPADALGFLQAISAMSPTWINSSPSVFRTFFASPRTNTIKTVVLGGEPVDAELVSSLAGRSLRMINSYGPAECSDVSIWHVCQMDAEVKVSEEIPIGRPIFGVEIFLLDSLLMPVGPGEVGEICIGGSGVGRGYLGRPDLTNERFVLHPTDSAKGLIYRTGDLGRLNSDGMYHFTGRQDFQVKVRGQRVELGEIETCLYTSALVKAVVVCAFDASPGDTRLVAYFIPKNDMAICAETLIQHLRNSLPNYMIPSSWYQLDSLPLSLSGKIDRSLLVRPEWAC